MARGKRELSRQQAAGRGACGLEIPELALAEKAQDLHRFVTNERRFLLVLQL